MDLPEHIICLHTRPDADGHSAELFVNKYSLRAYGRYHAPAEPPETPGWTWLAWSGHPGEHGWDALVVTESVEEVTRLLK